MVRYHWARHPALLVLLVGFLGGCAQQAERGSAANAAEEPHRMLAKGSTVSDSWLQIQREGSQASATPQRLSAAEQELANQRWLDSFNHPIPAFFERDSGGGFGED